MQSVVPKNLPKFHLASVLVIGDVMLDRYWFGDTSRVSPEAPVPVVKINNIDHRPGGAGNVAVNIAALGANAILLGLVGDDEAGEILKQQLQSAAVQHALESVANIPTTIKLRVISRHQQLLRMDFEESFRGVTDHQLINRFKHHLKASNLVILSDYNKGTIKDPQQFIQLARAAQVPILVDPKSKDFSIYRSANIITPNFKEFETIVGPCRTEHEIIEKGRRLLQQFEIEALLITRGEHGMTLINTNQAFHLPAYAREVFDVTGAGDTVIAVLGAAFAAGFELSDATAIANLAASLAVGKLGAATISQAELQVALTGKTTFTRGIVNEAEVCKAIKEVRAQGKKVIFTNGCFDILHAGHVTYLQMAKELGDFLIVAVNSDQSIRRIKGQSRPVNSIDDRMKVLAGIGAVDCVLPFEDNTPERLLKILRPDILVKGGDYDLSQVVGADIVHAYGGEVRIMNHQIKTTTTSILEQISEM